MWINFMVVFQIFRNSGGTECTNSVYIFSTHAGEPGNEASKHTVCPASNPIP